MEKSDTIQFLTIISGEHGNKFKFPRDTKEQTEVVTFAWHRKLKDFDKDLVLAAYDKFTTQNPEWPPNPAQILIEIDKIRSSEEEKLSAGEAWQNLMYCISRYGVNRPENLKECREHLSEATYKAALQTGGLEYLGHADRESLSYLQNRFIENFKYIQEEEKQERLLPSSLKKEHQQIEHKEKKKRELQDKKNKLAAKFTNNKNQLSG